MSTSRFIRYVFGLNLFCCLLLIFAHSAFAQSLFTGRVVDHEGAAVPEVRITVSSQGRQVASTFSDRKGEFSIPLGPGEYSLMSNAAGFADASQTIHITETNSGPIQIVLQIAEPTATVTITDTAGYQIPAISTATKTFTPLRDIPQSITVVSKEVAKDQSMQSIADVVRYVPGITSVQGENNRDQVIIRGNSSSADFFLDGTRDDVQYYRDLYNLERLEALKGPNAMIFGRGGGGGVINRVTRQADFASSREIVLQGGSYRNRRLTADVNQPLSKVFAFRVNGLYENSGSFRDQVDLERFGINPTLTIAAGSETQFKLGYEHFGDNRVADRGIPSFLGRPADIDISTFFGDPEQSRVRARVNLVSGVFEHQMGELNIRNKTLFGDYDRFYQNFVPGSVSSDQTRVTLSAYNNKSRRRNLFNQTDLTYYARTGSIRHTLLGGAEFGRQVSTNFRRTGFFNDTATLITVPLANPTVSIPVTFRQNATDADNHVTARIGATYFQDQIELTDKLQLLAGVRFDHFDLNFHNNRNSDNFRRIDNLISPRAGIIFKPIVPLSIYGSYSVSYLPSSGDQFSSLSAVTQTLKPEKFTNYEIGTKWDLSGSLSLTAAAYRLDRTNTRSSDPNDPTRIVQTGSQRTNGFELGLSGNVLRSWQVMGGYAYQDAFVTSATADAREDARVAQVPRNTFSFWNSYRFSRKWRAGLGLIHRSDMFAAIDNRVVLPGYTRADAAVYYSVTEGLALQANFENLFDKKYYVYAHSNDNISPGYPRTARLTLSWKF